jgi:serine/threonine protein kinase
MPSDPPAAKACVRCGATFDEAAPEGSICAACAASKAEEHTPTAILDEVPSQPQTGSVRVSAPAPVERIGDFEIHGKLGQGGMGAVYRARQVSLDRMVALKILPSQFEDDHSYVTRFQREASVAASLNHPNLVRVYTSGHADGCHFIAMELVEGENVRQHLKRTGPLPPLGALRICLDVARGLQCGWQKAQLIHRDIKPSNIYLSMGGEVKLGDLGLAKSLLSNTTGVTHTGTALGTPHYISPEQARGDKVIDFRADLYSLGCTLYELLTGSTPYSSSDPAALVNMHINGAPPAIMKVLPQCPILLGRLVNKLVRKAKHERHQSYEELIAAIEAAMEQIANPSTGPSATVEAWKEIGRAEQGFLPARGAALKASSAERPASTPRLPGEANLTSPSRRVAMRWAGVGAAALVIVVAAGLFLLNRKPEKRTELRPTTASNRSAQPVQASSSPAGGINPVPAPTTAAPVRLFDSPASIRPSEQVSWADGVLRIAGTAVQAPQPHKNVALRAEVLMNPESRNQQLSVRSRTGQGVGSYYALGLSASARKVSLDAWVEGERKSLGSWPLPRAYGPGEWLPIELRVVENEITISAEGTVIATLRDDSVPDAGGFRIYAAAAGFFRKIDYVPLDGVAPAETATLSRPAILAKQSQSEAWQNLFTNPAVFDPKEHLERAPNGALLSGFSHPPVPAFSDGALRVRFVVGKSGSMSLGARSSPDGGYNCFFKAPGEVWLQFHEPGAEYVTLQQIALPAPPAEGSVAEMEFRLVGFNLRVWLNGQLVIEKADHRLTRGTCSVSVPPSSPTELHSLELLVLDDSKAADANQVAGVPPKNATQNAPFINSLGMKFVPVPITGGPTQGQRVLFSVWDTRVQDYQVFATEAAREWPTPDFGQGPTHPAVQLSWEDAVAFCSWLTERERKAGKLSAQEEYRLPSDHEWSCAAGLGDDEDAAKLPVDKDGTIEDRFPWGTQWIPPAKSGNYAGEELQTLLAAGKHPYSKGWIKGYDDGYPETAPVGSFAASRLGLFDMSGNVWQWCADWFDKEQKQRVERGASWRDSNRAIVTSSRRYHKTPTTRDPSVGFRIVLAPASAAK